MLTAQRVKNFTPQNDSLTAPRRVEVTQPKMEQAAPQTPYSFPAVRDIDGGVKFEENKFEKFTKQNFASSITYKLISELIIN